MTPVRGDRSVDSDSTLTRFPTFSFMPSPLMSLIWGDTTNRRASHSRGDRDDFVYWAFTPAGLDAMARQAGFEGFELIDAPVIDGHPRVLGALRSGSPD
jgi:hypothetical protein